MIVNAWIFIVLSYGIDKVRWRGDKFINLYAVIEVCIYYKFNTESEWLNICGVYGFD